MLISVKPFGCMPSTQSDGVMAQVAASHPQLLFLPLETLGEGEVHALSRVQMALGDAIAKPGPNSMMCCLSRTSQWMTFAPTWRAIRRRAARLYRFRNSHDVAGTAAQFVLHVAKRDEEGRVSSWLVGLDIGSTTVKAVAAPREGGPVAWCDYRRHEAQQTETVIDFLRRLEHDLGATSANTALLMTGSGAAVLAPVLGARFCAGGQRSRAGSGEAAPRAQSAIELAARTPKCSSSSRSSEADGARARP